MDRHTGGEKTKTQDTEEPETHNMHVYTHKHTQNAANTTKHIQLQVMVFASWKIVLVSFQILMDGLKHSQLAVSFLQCTHGSTKANHLYVVCGFVRSM